MPRAITYCRVSSEEQAQKDISIPAQRKAIHRWAEQQPELVVMRDFEDQGISAYAPADRRPGFCELVSYCKKHDVDLILVHKLDRFSRCLIPRSTPSTIPRSLPGSRRGICLDTGSHLVAAA
jgi:site-specific DNA recombinase